MDAIVNQLHAPHGQPRITVQFPRFAVNATSPTFLPNRVQFTTPLSSAVSQLTNLASTGNMTPKVVITLRSGATRTLNDVIVTSVHAVASGGATSFEITLAYASTQSS